MSKDEALEKWLEAELPRIPVIPGSDLTPKPYQALYARSVARKAWYAAVEHALAYVAGELIKDADVLEREAESPSTCSEERT